MTRRDGESLVLMSQREADARASQERNLGLPDPNAPDDDPDELPARGIAERNHAGRTFQRWQHKPTLKGAARVWFYVDGGTVYLEQVHTAHPNETK